MAKTLIQLSISASTNWEKIVMIRCKYWEESTMHYCDFIDTTLNTNPETRIEIAVSVRDDSGLDVRLETGPEFGCVHGVRKDGYRGRG